ncbi:ClpP/crotonase-like domain-containing protein [Rhexocercosporidium sp. MPI-PUGE-AT-0058]|nr:ClpP/crotonase-like domain-containing protein [Rhexocercosporidium sp. MPI-PUGE-AT-0058]
MALNEKFTQLSLERNGNIFIVTLRQGPENKLNAPFCQEIIRAFHSIQRELGTAEGAVITRGSNEKFWCTGLDLEDPNAWANSDGFFPLLHTILDFPYPTIALVTGHTFGGGCPLALAHDYRIMNSHRGYICMPPVDLGLHFPGIGTLPRLKLGPKIARKMLLEAHKWTGKAALEDGVVDAIAGPSMDEMLAEAMKWAEKWKAKSKMGVYGILRNELWGEAGKSFRELSYVHSRDTSVSKAKL